MKPKLNCYLHRWDYIQRVEQNTSWRVCTGCGILQGKMMKSGNRWKTIDYNPDDLIVKPQGAIR